MLGKTQPATAGDASKESRLKRGVTPLEGDYVFALPYASCLSTFQAPGCLLQGADEVQTPHSKRPGDVYHLQGLSGQVCLPRIELTPDRKSVV